MLSYNNNSGYGLASMQAGALRPPVNRNNFQGYFMANNGYSSPPMPTTQTFNGGANAAGLAGGAGGVLAGLGGGDALAQAKLDMLNFNNSWLGGKGLAALQGVGAVFDMYSGYKAYKENKKNMALQREIAQFNLDQSKKEYNRLQGQRAGVTKNYNSNKVY